MDEQYRDASNLNARIALHERFSTNARGWMLWMFDQFELPTDACLLEVGCGSGKLWLENLDHIPEGWSTTLTDASPGMLREAEDNLRGSKRFRFKVADVQEPRFESGTFDAVISNHVLQHVPDRRRAISEIDRVLRIRGVLYAATGGRNHMRKMNRMMRVLAPTHPDGSLARRIGGFSMENGAGQLSSRFANVSLRRYEDSLIVTQARPLVDCVLSAMTVQEAIFGLSDSEIETRAARLTYALEREISGRTAIHITKDTGPFMARK